MSSLALVCPVLLPSAGTLAWLQFISSFFISKDHLSVLSVISNNLRLRSHLRSVILLVWLYLPAAGLLQEAGSSPSVPAAQSTCAKPESALLPPARSSNLQQSKCHAGGALLLQSCPKAVFIWFVLTFCASCWHAGGRLYGHNYMQV